MRPLKKSSFIALSTHVLALSLSNWLLVFIYASYSANNPDNNKLCHHVHLPRKAFFDDHFALSATTAAIADVVIPDEITCVSFDAGWDGFGASNWVYVQAIKVEREPSDIVDKAAKFDGTGHLEIPRFSNAYGQWSQFAVSFWYKRDSQGGSAVQGLISNGNCVAEPSIGIKSNPGTIEAVLVTSGGRASVTGVTVRYTYIVEHVTGVTVRYTYIVEHVTGVAVRYTYIVEHVTGVAVRYTYIVEHTYGQLSDRASYCILYRIAILISLFH